MRACGFAVRGNASTPSLATMIVVLVSAPLSTSLVESVYCAAPGC